MQAIVTRYFGPAARLGSRIKAKARAGSITVHYDSALGSEANHDKAASALADKFKWAGEWYSGGAPDGSGDMVYVNVAPSGIPTFTTYGER